MSSPRPLRPLSPPSANLTASRPAYLDKVGDHEESHTSGSEISGLTSLENDPEGEIDDFDRLLIQNERKQRGLSTALRGQVQPFSRARAPIRLAQTMQALERQEVHINESQAFGSPDSGSGGSDPAVRPPRDWGRKARVKKNWIRTITVDSEAGAEVEGHGTESQDQTPKQTSGRVATPIEDSPLSHKGSRHGTPASYRRSNVKFDKAQDPSLDFSIDFNEASMIASTPYVPRNTLLDEIRQREIESLNDQEIAGDLEADDKRQAASNVFQEDIFTNTLHINRRNRSPSHKRMSESSVKNPQQAPRVRRTIEPRPRDSPQPPHKQVAKSIELDDPEQPPKAQSNLTPPLRPSRRRDESHSLLRRLARIPSSTPSPRGPAVAGPDNPPRPPMEKESVAKDPAPNSGPVEKMTMQESSSNEMPTRGPLEDSSKAQTPSSPRQDSDKENMEATPVPAKPPLLNMKTPVVTGAWVETPAPRTTRKGPLGSTSSRSRSPGGRTANEDIPASEVAQRGSASEVEQPAEPKPPARPRSALEAIVNEARMNGGQSQEADDFGDSTIESLAGLIGQDGDDEPAQPDDDTLHGLQLPTTAPRTEAERIRQQELAQLHNMRQTLRTTATSVRDASRGLRRVEHQVEHNEERIQRRPTGKVECPCPVDGHNASLWTIAWRSTKRLFYRPESPKRFGLTWFAIASIAFWIWFISEELACQKYCHKIYAPRMVGFGVDKNAPRYPFVIPTLLWRKVFKHIWGAFYCVWTLVHDLFFESETAGAKAATTTAASSATTVLHARQTFEPDLGFGADEFI